MGARCDESRRNRATASLLALCGALLGSCTSIPQPQPVPDLSLTLRSQDSRTESLALVVGLPGAVPTECQVELTVPRTGARQQVDCSPQGSFAATISALGDDYVELRLIVGGEAGDPVELPLVPFGRLELKVGAGADAPVSPPGPGGLVTVTNDFAEPPLIAAPDKTLVVANTRTGEVATARVDSAGRFTVQLAGQSGDSMNLVLRDPDVPDTVSNYLVYTVP